MHELSICQALIHQVEQLCVQHQAQRVTHIVVRVGALSGVEADLLHNAFSIACAGTVAAEATLDLQTQPIRVRCRVCGAETEASANRLLCGVCASWQTNLLSGDELLLASVELDQDETKL